VKANTQASRMQKGKRLENKVASLMRSKLGAMAVRMSGSGSGYMKGDVYNKHFSVECKNQEKVSIWKFWDQTTAQVQALRPPALIISGNYRPILVVMDINDWLDLVKEAKCE